MKIKAVIFDMDGVLVDSEITYIRLWQTFLAENGVSVSIADLRFLAGSSREIENQFLSKMLHLSVREVEKKKKDFYQKHPINYKNIQKPFSRQLLSFLKEKEIKIALASSSPMENIEEVLLQCDIYDFFSFLVSGEQFEKTKPDPQIYEYTVQQLGLEKEEILVIEDSEYGITSATSAGLTVIALLDPILQFNVSKATYQIKTLKDAINIIERRNQL
ncbi:HAD family hydrolase [Faecalitalea cylindroides]|uniref:HAD family hydrolase n=1 Tax=Faecalitalea cylindroides TaxID=39483 RepID=UPI0022E1F946|nr:HAD family phosphatase [Faecalitalea cylindroides]